MDREYNLVEHLVDIPFPSSLCKTPSCHILSNSFERSKKLERVSKLGVLSNAQYIPYCTTCEKMCIDYLQCILLRGHRIIIPTNLPSKVVEIAHEGHQGQAKTKALLREYVWLLLIDNTVQRNDAQMFSLSSEWAA